MQQVRFFHQFAALLKAGISVQQGLTMAGKEGSAGFQKSLREASLKIELGQDLASSLDLRYFDRWTLSLLRAAEYSGALVEACERLAIALETQQKHQRLYRSIKISGLLVLLAILALAIALVQRGTAFLLQPWFWIGNLLLIAAFVGVSRLAKVPTQTQTLLRSLTGVPLVQGIVDARSVLYFSQLEQPLRCGVPVLQSLELVRNHTPDPVMAQTLTQAVHQVQGGRSLSQSLQGKLPRMAWQMLRTGEETGHPEAALRKVTEYYEAELERNLQALQGILRPLGILAVGSLALLVGIQSVSFILKALPN